MMKKRNFLLIIPVLILAFHNCAYYNTFYNAKKFFQKANEERQKRRFDQEKPSGTEKQNYDKAIEKASAVLELYPKSKYVDDALMLLGQAFYHQQDYQKAKRKFEEILGFYPDGDFGDEAKIWLARADMELKNYEEAETMLHRLLTSEKIDKKLAENAQIMLGDLYFNKENYMVAADVYKRATIIAHDKEIKSRSFMRLGDSYLELKKYPEAIEAFRVAVKKSPNNQFKNNAMYNLGQAQSQSGNYEDAIKTFTKLLSIETDNERVPMVKLQIAENIRFKGNLEKAMEWYKSIIEDHKRTDASARSYFAIGLVQEQAADYVKAKESFENVRAEYARSEILDDAKIHTDNISKLLQLKDDIAILEGRKVEKQAIEKDNKNPQAAFFSGLDPSLLLLARKYQGRPQPRKLMGSQSDNLAQANSPGENSENAGDDSTRTTAANGAKAEDIEKDRASKAAKGKELANKKFQLAELLLFQFDQLDSAVIAYQEIYNNPNAEEFYPLAIYSLAYINDKIKNNQQAADSFYQILAENYPDTPHGIAAREKLNILVNKVTEDRYKKLYLLAENKYREDEDSKGALELFQVIVDSFPESEYAPKAKYAQAWIYERELFDMKRAQALYQEIADNFSQTEYAKRASPKLNAIKDYEKILAARKDSLATAKAMQDSLASIEQVPDSLKKTRSDSLASEMAIGAESKGNGTVQTPSTGTTPPENKNMTNPADGKSKETRKITREDEDENEAPAPVVPSSKSNAVTKDDSLKTRKPINP